LDRKWLDAGDGLVTVAVRRSFDARIGARRAVDRPLWVASLHDRGCGGYRGADRLGNKADRPRESRVESVELKLFAVG